MQDGKKLIRGTLCLISLIGIVNIAQAEKSVFIISKHSIPSQAQAYRIDGDQITYQAQVDIDTYNPGVGAVGNAVWPEKELMFVTYENSPMIVWASTKTLEKVGEFNTGVISLSGITVDEGNEKIYVVQRQSDNLYVYSFDEPNNTLVLDNHYDLDVPSGSLSAWGTALEETNGLLYPEFPK
jgi:DNA-binding beta-propeller fold protein YncE